MALRHLATQAGEQSRKVLGLKDVQHIIAVASGKGGVGKSTTAVNMTVAMAAVLGMRVGLMDADVHGPSIPTMMNLKSEEPTMAPNVDLMEPPTNYGVKCMSMGFFMKGDTPVVWRGPMVNSAIDRFLLGTNWGSLDVLVVDMPPGTGDAQISLSQRLPLSGAVVVSTPQDVALLDARRGAQMFAKVHVPVLGMVENMSYYACPQCGHRDHVFGEGGVARAAAELGLDVLGQLPLNGQVCETSDRGTPIVVSQPSSPLAAAYVSVAGRVRDKLMASQRSQPRGPTITVS